MSYTGQVALNLAKKQQKIADEIQDQIKPRAKVDFGTIARKHSNGADLTVALKEVQNEITTKYGGGVIYLPAGITYNFSNIELLNNISLIGESRRYTVLKALESNEKGFIKLGKGAITRVEMADLRIEGLSAVNALQNGFHFDAIEEDIPAYTGGLWYSRFHDIDVRNFDGHGLFLRAVDGRGDLANQFLRFQDMTIIRPAKETSHCLYAVGQLGQTQFDNVQMDGTNANGNKFAPGVNVRMGRSFVNGTPEGDVAPSNIQFINGTTLQMSEKGVLLDRCNNITFRDVWFEDLKYGGEASVSSQSINLKECKFSNAASDGNGTGYAFKYGSNCTGSFADLYIDGNTDRTVIGENDGGVRPGNIYSSAKTAGITKQFPIPADGNLNIGYAKDLLVSATTTPAELRKFTHKSVVGELIRVSAWSLSHTDGKGIKISHNADISLQGRTDILLRHQDTAVFQVADLGQTMVLVGLEQRTLKANNPTVDLAGALVAVGEIIHRSTPTNANTMGWIVTTAGLIGTTAVISPIITTDSIGDASAVGRNVLKATDAAAARTAIGAGTSSLVIGTTATTAAAGNHTHTTANITGLDTALSGKLTASKVATQANSTATDVTGLVTDFNALIAKLKAAGVMS